MTRDLLLGRPPKTGVLELEFGENNKYMTLEAKLSKTRAVCETLSEALENYFDKHENNPGKLIAIMEVATTHGFDMFAKDVKDFIKENYPTAWTDYNTSDMSGASDR